VKLAAETVVTTAPPVVRFASKIVPFADGIPTPALAKKTPRKSAVTPLVSGVHVPPPCGVRITPPSLPPSLDWRNEVHVAQIRSRAAGSRRPRNAISRFEDHAAVATTQPVLAVEHLDGVQVAVSSPRFGTEGACLIEIGLGNEAALRWPAHARVEEMHVSDDALLSGAREKRHCLNRKQIAGAQF